MKNKQQKPDIIAVAKAARVSASTVSRSFNHPELVNPATRKKIDSAVRKLGYLRNRAAQTIHGIRSATIGLIVPTIDHSIFAEVIQAFSDSVGEQGFTILLATHGYDLGQEYRLLRKMLEHRVDGVALIGTDHDPESHALLAQQNVPAITIWNYDTTAKLPCVGASNYEAGQEIAKAVLNAGHREIALMFPPLAGNDRASDRMAGVQDCLLDAGVVVPANRNVEAPYSLSDAKTRSVDLLNAPNPPSVILCGNDVLALGAINGARQLGLEIARDVSVTGIGDFKDYRDLEPALTTVRLPARRIGAMAGDSICQAILNKETRPENLHCPPELMVRETLAQLV